MVRSIAHPSTSRLHRAHRARARRMWLIMAVLIALAALAATLGYFTPVSWGPLAGALAKTTYRLIFAYGIALALATATALLVGWSPWSDYLFPFFDILQNIPSFAIIPLFIYFFGFTAEMIVLFAVSSIVWPILFAILTAIKTAHADLNDAATVYGATGWRRIPFYLAPLAYPAMLTGSVVGIAIGWESVIGAEIIASTSGFGAFIKSAGETGITPATVAGVIGILFIVFVANRLIWAPLLAESAKRYAE